MPRSVGEDVDEHMHDAAAIGHRAGRESQGLCSRVSGILRLQTGRHDEFPTALRHYFCEADPGRLNDRAEERLLGSVRPFFD